MKYLKTQDEIMSTWKNNHDKPLVSICCITYNHEPYIEDSLDGFLIQETDFAFEIIIHDDASTDRTEDIIRKYEARYPKIIKPIYQKENQYSKGIKPISLTFEMAKGKYIAVCEGDDYWTDPKKLQIQFDFLEQNPDYVISGHNACIIDDRNNKVTDSKLPDSQKRDFSGDDLLCGKVWVLTLSWMFRNVLKELPPEYARVINEDTFILSLLGKYGKSKYHDDIKPAYYRIHQGGIWSMLDIEAQIDSQINTFFLMYSYHKRVGNKKASQIFFNNFSAIVLRNTPLKKLLREVIARFYLKLKKIVF